MSDGQHLFTYFDINSYNNLCYTHRKATFPTIRLVGTDTHINLQSEKDATVYGFIISTSPISIQGERWSQCNRGRLIVFKEGRML
jgi:predicted glutamine amidotransferase